MQGNYKMTKCNHCQVYSINDYGTCPHCGAPLIPFYGKDIVITAEWTGRYPALCCGKWLISIDGVAFPIPENKISETMNTFGSYQTWHFDEHWSEIFEDYEDGLDTHQWIAENKGWIDEGLAKINKHFSYKDYCTLYDAIQKVDFRRGSCGGCI